MWTSKLYPKIHNVIIRIWLLDQKDIWNKEAFTIGGKKFDLKLTSASDGEYVSIAKLSQ